MIQLKNVTIRFKNKTVFHNLYFKAQKGEIVGVVAPNGTGKTTLFNTLMNFVIPYQGEIIIDGLKHPKKTVEIRKKMTILPNQAELYNDFKGIEHLKIYADLWGNNGDIDNVISLLQMEDYIEKKVKTYSLGMRQRLCFAMVLAANTEIMLLDEVMNGLDPYNVEIISNILIDLRSKGRCILIASHLLANLNLYANRTIFLANGEIVHELNLNNQDEKYVIVHASKKKIQKIQQFNCLQGVKYILAENMIAVPVDKIVSQSDLIDEIFQIDIQEVKLGVLGNPEYYNIYYRNSTKENSI